MKARDSGALQAGWLLLSIGVFVHVLVLIRTAWLCDDAYVTFRVVDNLWNGYGLRWNVVDRVQAFTHPLWMGVLAGLYGITSELQVSTMVLSLLLGTATATLIVTRLAATPFQALLALLVMTLSRAYVDYSTSGLENPLSHILIALFFVLSHNLDTRSTRRTFYLVFGLLVLARMDNVLVAGPTVVLLGLRGRWRSDLPLLATGVGALLAWMAFSLFYFGFAFPNTAYVKLSTGVPRLDLIQQGATYLFDSVSRDPTTLLIAATAIAAAAGLRTRRLAALAVGILLHVGYVVWIGGDFMSGRFLAVPFLVGVITLASADFAIDRTSFAVAAVSLSMLGLMNPYPTVASNSVYFSHRQGRSEHIFGQGSGITDERGIYYRNTGLLTARRGLTFTNHYFAEAGRDAKAKKTRLIKRGTIGMYGYFAGSPTHVLDGNGLADALMARMPSKPVWRIGHFSREFPPGYAESIKRGANEIQDPDLRAYYAVLLRVTTGDLLYAGRVGDIWSLHFGAARARLAKYYAFHSRPKRIRLEDVASPVPEREDWRKGVRFSAHGLRIDLGEPRHGRELELSVDNEKHNIRLFREGTLVFEGELPAGGGGLRRQYLVVDAAVAAAGYDRVDLRPLGGDGRYALGHLTLRPEPTPRDPIGE